jgi:putative MATE family efflux protein
VFFSWLLEGTQGYIGNELGLKRRPLPLISTQRRRHSDYSLSSPLLTSAQAVEEKDDNDKTLLQRKKAQLTREFVGIGGPALIQLAAEPLAALVDSTSMRDRVWNYIFCLWVLMADLTKTSLSIYLSIYIYISISTAAYLGRLGPEVLGGAGVAVSAQYAVSKLYNDPLLRTSISLVAAQEGKSRQETDDNGSTTSDSTVDTNVEATADKKQRDLSIAVSSALLLAATVGIVQLVIYSVFCRGITRSMGVTPTSPMWHSAVSYLQIRALGTPAATLWLVANGIFRGLGDTRTPLFYSLGFTALNAILDPLFIFGAGWGAAGAAAGTALAQYTALIPLLAALNRKVPIDIWGQLSDLKTSLKEYMTAGGLVLFRTLAKVLAYSVCARQAAMLGSVAAAAYNLTFQLGFATTQICEAVAVAVQTLLAREMAQPSKKYKAAVVRHLINTSVLLGGSVAVILSLSTYWRRDWILAGLTTNPAIRSAAAAIFPVVLITQVLKGLAYPVNGIIMGGLDWFYSMNVMWASNAVCLGLLQAFKMASGGALLTLTEIWWALAAFMGTQVVAGMIRYQSRTGVWKVMRS